MCRVTEEGGGQTVLGAPFGQFQSPSLPLNRRILLLPGHVIWPAQEVEERGASAQDSSWEGSGRRWRKRCEFAVIFSLSSLWGLG